MTRHSIVEYDQLYEPDEASPPSGIPDTSPFILTEPLPFRTVEDRVREMVRDGYDDECIASWIGVTPGTVRAYRREFKESRRAQL